MEMMVEEARAELTKRFVLWLGRLDPKLLMGFAGWIEEVENDPEEQMLRFESFMAVLTEEVTTSLPYRLEQLFVEINT